MSQNHTYTPESALAIVAYPDDIEFSCAGTLARWARQGARAGYVVCTSGEVGIIEAGMTKTRTVLATTWGKADQLINITETIDLKLETLCAHKSQMGDWGAEEMVHNWAAGRATGKEIAYAAAFRVVILISDEDREKTKGRVLPE